MQNLMFQVWVPGRQGFSLQKWDIRGKMLLWSGRGRDRRFHFWICSSDWQKTAVCWKCWPGIHGRVHVGAVAGLISKSNKWVSSAGRERRKRGREGGSERSPEPMPEAGERPTLWSVSRQREQPTWKTEATGAPWMPKTRLKGSYCGKLQCHGLSTD